MIFRDAVPLIMAVTVKENQGEKNKAVYFFIRSLISVNFCLVCCVKSPCIIQL